MMTWSQRIYFMLKCKFSVDLFHRRRPTVFPDLSSPNSARVGIAVDNFPPPLDLAVLVILAIGQTPPQTLFKLLGQTDR